MDDKPESRWTAAVETYRAWQHSEDTGILAFIAGAFLANKYDSDPVWPMIIGGPGSGKTELLRSIDGLDKVYIRSTITEAGLLSGVPKKDQSSAATGGLLRQIGFDQSYIVIKDFGSILAMNRHMRSGLLQALRDIYDGNWSRQLGADGGMALEWKGKISFMCAATGAIDQHHNAMAALGERFVYYRLPESSSEARILQASSAIQHIGKTKKMRDGLKEMIHDLLLPLPELPDIATFPKPILDSIAALADLTSMARSVVERDYYTPGKDIVDVPDQEHGTRLAQALALLFGGMRAVGVPEPDAKRVLRKCALDSIPPLRRSVLEQLRTNGPTRTVKMQTKVGRMVLQRCLEDLLHLGLVLAEVDKDDRGKPTTWSLSDICRERYKTAGFKNV